MWPRVDTAKRIALQEHRDSMSYETETENEAETSLKHSKQGEMLSFVAVSTEFRSVGGIRTELSYGFATLVASCTCLVVTRRAQGSCTICLWTNEIDF